MPQLCTVCIHPQAAVMESVWAAGLSSVSAIARDFRVGRKSVERHMSGHLQRTGRVVAPRAKANATTAAPAAPGSVALSPSEGPVEVFRAAFGKDPMPHQTAYLEDARPTLVLKGRQVGISTAAAGLSVATARATAGADALLISASQRQSTEITVKARLAFDALGDRLVKDSASMLQLENGSRVISLPSKGRSIRGYSPALVVIDEAAFVDDDAWDAARPLVAASGGRMIVQSTPGNPVGFFYELAQSTPETWLRIVVRSDEVPTISAEYLASERAHMDPVVYAQEYEAQFAVASLKGGWFPVEEYDRRVDPRFPRIEVPDGISLEV